MQNKFRILILLAVSLALTGLIKEPGLTETSMMLEALAPKGATSWVLDTIESDGDVGQYVSMAMDRAVGAPYIAYYDLTLGELRLAYYIGSGGYCSGSAEWDCLSLDRDATGPNSIAVYEGEATPTDPWKLGVAYPIIDGWLRYLVYTCTGPIDCYWSYTDIEQTDGIDYLSMKYGPNGQPHIAYRMIPVSGIQGEIRYATWVGNGGNCGEGVSAGQWSCEEVLSDEGIDPSTARYGFYISMDVDSINHPRLAFYESINGDLWYARLVGNGGNCQTNTRWYCSKVDEAGDVGYFSSLAIRQGQIENPQIAYYDRSNYQLKYASMPDTDTNCGPYFGGTQLWRCDAITSLSLAHDTLQNLSLGANSIGDVAIAYSSDVLMNMAVPAEQSGQPGNCGPIDDLGGGNFVYTWRCDVLDGTVIPNEKTYNATALDDSGLAVVAYYDPAAGDLKVAYQPMLSVFLPLLFRGGVGSPAPSPTSTPLITSTQTNTPTPTHTFTPTHTPTFTATNTFTPTHTPTSTATPSPTPDSTPSDTPTPTSTSVPNVFIDAIEPNPIDDPLNEYVQIKNGTSQSISLTNWRLRDESGNIFFFPDFTLGAGGTVKVWTKVGIDDSSNLYWDRTEEVWNDNSDCAYLRDQNNELIDAECYSLPLSWLNDLLH